MTEFDKTNIPLTPEVYLAKQTLASSRWENQPPFVPDAIQALTDLLSKPPLAYVTYRALMLVGAIGLVILSYHPSLHVSNPSPYNDHRYKEPTAVEDYRVTVDLSVPPITISTISQNNSTPIKIEIRPLISTRK